MPLDLLFKNKKAGLPFPGNPAVHWALRSHLMRPFWTRGFPPPDFPGFGFFWWSKF